MEKMANVREKEGKKVNVKEKGEKLEDKWEETEKKRV